MFAENKPKHYNPFIGKSAISLLVVMCICALKIQQLQRLGNVSINFISVLYERSLVSTKVQMILWSKKVLKIAFEVYFLFSQFILLPEEKLILQVQLPRQPSEHWKNDCSLVLGGCLFCCKIFGNPPSLRSSGTSHCSP